MRRLFAERIVILDGAMGTMIQKHKLDEAAYRGERFKAWPRELKGCNDLLVLTQPELIADIHRQFIDAGADLISTNTFNSNSTSMADYGLEASVYELNLAADAAGAPRRRRRGRAPRPQGLCRGRARSRRTARPRSRPT